MWHCRAPQMCNNRARSADDFVTGLPNLERVVKIVEIFTIAFVEEDAPGLPQVDQKTGATKTLSNTRFIWDVYQVCVRSPIISHEPDAGM